MCKGLLSKLMGRVSRRVSKDQPVSEEVETRKEKEPRKWWQFPVRLVRTRRLGPNMPKRQPCPSCHAGAKRKFKTEFGANYVCRCGRVFFVGR